MKLYSFLGRLYFLIFIYITSISWSLPFQRSSSHVELNYNRKRHINGYKENVKSKDGLRFLLKVKPRFDKDFILETETSAHIQDISTTHKYSGNVIEYKNSHAEVSLAEALTQESGDKSSFNMVLPIAGTLTVLFSMSILVALFHCCCRKRQTSETEEVKDNEKLVDSGKDVSKEDEKSKDQTQGPEDGEKEATSIKSKIKAFEGIIPTQPSPGLVRPMKKRPESEAFKALENQGILIGVGKSPSRLSKTPEDENQNATLNEEVPKTEKPNGDTNPDDELGGYKEPENPDVVIADVDDDDEFAVIKRDTSVLRSHKRAPPPKNRNRSSAAVRRKRARETNADTIFNDSSDNSFLNVPDDLEVVYNDKKSNAKSDSKNNSTERNKSDSKNNSTERNKKDKKDKNVNSSEKNRNKKDKNQTKTDVPEIKSIETPAIITSDHSDDKIIDLSKQAVPPEVFSGGNIFMHIDPTVKKNAPKIAKKPATPPTRLRTSQLSVEERKEKAKSTPLLSGHEDLAKAIGKLRSPSTENTSDKFSGKNRSSTDISSSTAI